MACSKNRYGIVLVTATALAAALWAAPRAHAEEDQPRLLPGGIVYPEYNSEGTGNPGTLNRDDARLARVLVSPNIFGSNTQAAAFDYTVTWPGYGFDAGYDGSRTVGNGMDPSPITNVIHGAAGFRADKFGIGLVYKDQLNNSGFSSPPGPGSIVTPTPNGGGELDLGTMYELSSKSRIAMTLDNLTGSPNATLGIGITEESVYALEVNLALPSFAAGLTSSGSTYVATLAGSLYAKSFGVGFVIGYDYVLDGNGSNGNPNPNPNSNPNFTHAFTLMYKFTKTCALTARFDTNNYLTVGLTFKL